MKTKYTTPKLTVEFLIKSDVLLLSFETDNNYVESKDIFKDDFKIEDIL